MSDANDWLSRDLRETGRSITAENMSDRLASELVEEIDNGEWELNDWEMEFIGGNLGRKSFSTAQKAVILKLAKRCNLL